MPSVDPKKEPLLYYTLGVLAAAIGLGSAFDIINWTAEQTGAIGIFVIAVFSLAFYVRSKVSPVNGSTK